MTTFPVQAPRAVIDTNIVFEGLTKQGGASGLIIEAWLTGVFRACVSNALAYEYIEVCSRELSEARWQEIQPILEKLFAQAEFVPIYFSWRPISPDSGDDHIIDCAMNGGAVIVTFNIRDFRLAEKELGVPLMTPVEFVTMLASVWNSDTKAFEE